ncbi:glycosyltransferase [Nocardioides sp. GXQ0305]|uniref:glycosyltransferase n=1 Tax=Nocardioides sp. GXQ0305 TaxID=3423912 RepID=UPI003D7D32F2
MKVLWLTKGLGRGGAEMLLVGLARAMDRRDLTIEVAYQLPGKTALVGTLEELGVRTHLIGGGAAWPWSLRRLVREQHYDIVHSHAPLVGAAARVVAPAGTVLLHTEHNTWQRYHPATRLANAATIARNDQVWAVSDQVAESIRLPRPLRLPDVDVMLHGVDPSSFPRGPEARCEGRRRLGIGEDVLVFGSVGNLAVKKDQITMIRAFGEAHRQLPASRLVLIGTGPREPYLRSLAEHLGLADVVHFLGMRDDVPALLPALDVFVLSSLHEGLSIAVVEALAAGVPVISTNVGGLPQLITDGEHGVLIRPRDADALTREMLRLGLDDAERARLALAGPRRAEKFGIQAAADALVERYRRSSGRRDPEGSVR